jgi:sugar lactone lactonase YvrE
MPSKPSPAPQAKILMTGIAMGESPRWHENRLWFSDWGAQEILAVDPHGKSEVAWKDLRRFVLRNYALNSHGLAQPRKIKQLDKLGRGA